MNKHIILFSLFIFFLKADFTSAEDNPEELGAFYDYINYDCEVKDNRLIEKYTWKKTILNQRGDRFNRILLAKQPSTTLKKLKVTVFDADGKKVYERKPKDMVRTEGFGTYALYDDMKMYLTECQAPSYPYSIEYEHEVEYKTLFFWRGADVQRRLPVRSFSYRLTADKDFPFEYRADSLPGEPEITGDKKTLRYRWEKQDIPAYDPDDFEIMEWQPAELKFVPGNFQFDDYEFSGISWKNVGAWYRDLAANRYFIDTAQAPLGDGDDTMAVLKEIYEQVIGETRYVLVSIGISGWQPAYAKETEQCGYGDCKGLSTLLISRLRSRGFEVYPVLVRTRDIGPVSPDFAEFGFNHVIAAAVVNNDTVWMDATCTSCPFGDLPRMDEDTYCLLITDTGGVLVRTPASETTENEIINRAELEVLSDGLCKLQSQIFITGNYASLIRLRYAHFDSDEARRFIQKLFLPEGGTRYQLESYTVDNLNDIDAPLVFSIEARSKRPCDEINGVRYVKIPALNSGQITIDESARSVDINAPLTVTDSLTVSWNFPGRVDSVALPTDAYEFYSHGRAVSTSSLTESGRAVINIKRINDLYFLNRPVIEEYREYRNRLKRLTNEHINIYLTQREQ